MAPKAEIIVISSDEEEVTIRKKKIYSKTSENDDSSDDCVILDGDPDKPIQVVNVAGNKSDELIIVAEKGQVACRDYPHPRHLCVTFPFDTNPHEKYCSLCHCYVCDALAPCAFWGAGTSKDDHCHSTDKEEIWRLARKILKSSKQAKLAHFPKSNIPERVPVAPPSLDPEVATLTWESSTFRDQLVVQEDRATGVVKCFYKRKGYGFIIPDSGGTDLFFHKSSLKSKGFQSLADGEKVQYRLVNGDCGRYEAVEVSGPGGSFIQEATRSNSSWESSTFQDQLVVQEDRATGVVKWFNKRKGYGRIIPDSGGTDLFVHKSSIKSKGFKNLTDGEKVEYRLVNGDFGRFEAVDVSSPGRSFIQETSGSDSSSELSTFQDQLVVQEDRETGVVKWFSKWKGYGFITPDSGGMNLFFHKSSINSNGFQGLTDGEKVEYQLVNGDCGRYEVVDVSKPRCYTCGEPGHLKKHCYRGSSARGGGHAVQCYCCGEHGHLAISEVVVRGYS